MGIGTAIAAAASIGGALIGSSSSRSAANTVAQSTDAQVNLMRDIHNDQRNLQMPFYNTGVAANRAAAELLGVSPMGGVQTQYSQQSAPYTNALAQALAAQNGGGMRIPFKAGPSSTQQNQLAMITGGNNSGIGRVSPDSLYVNPQTMEIQRNGMPGIINVGGGRYMPSGQPAITNGAAQTGTPQQPANDSGYQNNQLRALVESPGYQFRLNEGMNALDQSAAARGGLLSGGHIRRGTRYAQDYASNEYNNRFNQLQALAGGGQAAAGNVQAAGSQYASGATNAMGQNAYYAAQQQQQRGSMYGGALGSIGGILAGQF